VRVLQTEITKDGELILSVESTLTSTTCRYCRRTITERHGLDEPRLLRHLPILGRVVYLRIRPKRFRCPWCDNPPTTTQTLDWYDPNALHTTAYERRLIVQLVNGTLTDVEAKEDVTTDALLGILDRWVATTVDWAAPQAGITQGYRIRAQTDVVALTQAVS
jgi:transposase